jgi:hypothetical protein
MSDAGLLIHLGGLGDVCLSESTILSITRHFGGRLRAAGNKPVLDAFDEYFSAVDSMERRRWACLFSDALSGPRLHRVIFIGKDRSGLFRERIGRFADDVVFIDMYPEGRSAHVEDHQLAQLASYGIAPVRKVRDERPGRRVILYPEKPYRKRKWPVESFLDVHKYLKARDIEAEVMRQPGLNLPAVPSTTLDTLSDIEAFLSKGGIFFSNDSGMAHFAARCGLHPITLCFDTDPTVWRPLAGEAIKCKGTGPCPEEVASLIAAALPE